MAALGGAQAGEGLDVGRDAQLWPRWQARLSIHTGPTDLPSGAGWGSNLRSLGVMGDYYFLRAPLGERSSGGFRATSGVLLGQSTGAWALPAGGAANIGRRQSALAPTDGAPDGQSTAPYAGVGYSALAANGGWGFSADLGLLAVGSRVRFGQPPGAAQRLDDAVRDLRLMPVLQLGVSYSF
jgi:hypothetical protein